MTAKAASLAAGASESFVKDLLSGKSRNPTASRLSQLARVLAMDLAELMPDAPVLTSASVRFAALHDAVGGPQRVADALGLPEIQIAAWATGRDHPIPQNVLVSLALKTGESLDWLVLGRGQPLIASMGTPSPNQCRALARTAKGKDKAH